MMRYQGVAVYWEGEEEDCSTPVHVHSELLATREEAKAWGDAKRNTPSPWPGRDFEDHHEVIEYEDVDGDLEDSRRWIYWGDDCDEIVDYR